jgi:hypothetical protein
VAFAADHDVVVDGDAERARGVDDGLRHLDVGARRCRVARGVVMDLRWSTMKHSIMRNTHIKLR